MKGRREGEEEEGRGKEEGKRGGEEKATSDERGRKEGEMTSNSPI